MMHGQKNIKSQYSSARSYLAIEATRYLNFSDIILTLLDYLKCPSKLTQ
jgi:hypothetical protein